jgi:HAD superfamily hydrolase (TIGR01509 family)
VLRAICFDFNGVLVDDEPLHCRLLLRVLAEEGLALTERDYYQRFLGFDDRDCFRTAFAEAGRSEPAERIARLIARKAAYYQTEIRRAGYPFFPGAVELLRAAAADGLLLAVVSGALRDEVEGALRQSGVAALVRVVVSAEDVAASKPDPEGYRRALAALNSEPPAPERLIHPHEAVAIEDSPAGLESAAGAGLRTVGVAQTYPAAELGGAELVVGSLAELTVPRLRARLGA